jgi:hypothetical protein
VIWGFLRPLVWCRSCYGNGDYDNGWCDDGNGNGWGYGHGYGDDYGDGDGFGNGYGHGDDNY